MKISYLGRNDQLGLLKPILMKTFFGKLYFRITKEDITKSMPWQNSAIKSVLK